MEDSEKEKVSERPQTLFPSFFCCWNFTFLFWRILRSFFDFFRSFTVEEPNSDILSRSFFLMNVVDFVFHSFLRWYRVFTGNYLLVLLPSFTALLTWFTGSNRAFFFLLNSFFLFSLCAYVIINRGENFSERTAKGAYIRRVVGPGKLCKTSLDSFQNNSMTGRSHKSLANDKNRHRLSRRLRTKPR